jgi:glyoxylase-like metal-dependent hydrolase (beta-lactamase superfamily II)
MMDNERIKILKIPAGRSNLYIVQKNKTCLMIDAGYSGMNKIDKVLKTNNIDYKDIKMVILTHTHYDHVNLLYDLNKKIYAEIVVHRAGEKFLKFGQTPDPKNGTLLGKLLLFANKIGGNGKFKPVVPDTVIDGDVLTNKPGFDINIIPTPGHTKDSITVIVNKKWAFVGDTVFNMFPGNFYPMFVDDKKALKESWEKLLDLQCDYYFPGHGKKISYALLEKAYHKIF